MDTNTTHINSLLSQSDSEFSDMYLRTINNHNYTSDKLFNPAAYQGDLPESIDWRNKGAVSSVKNQVYKDSMQPTRHMGRLENLWLTIFQALICCVQGQCGASYAFSAMGVLEGAWALAHGKLTALSEQNIIDCSGQFTFSPSL